MFHVKIKMALHSLFTCRIILDKDLAFNVPQDFEQVEHVETSRNFGSKCAAKNPLLLSEVLSTWP